MQNEARAKPRAAVRARIGVLVCAGISCAAAVARADAGGVQLARDPGDAETVVGRVEVAAAPDVVWERFRRVDRWREMFSDVKKLEVRRHEGHSWRIRLDSGIFTCGPHDYLLEFAAAARTASLEIDAPGIDARGTMSAVAGGAPGRTVFEYRLRVHVGRVAGWFVSERDIRDKQERLVRQYLADLARAFGGTGPAHAAR